MTLLLISLAGGLGAAARFILDDLLRRRFPDRLFPPGIVVANILGSFLLGLVVGGSANRAGLSPTLAAVLGTGFCGGFTTFSTASLEAVHLWVNERRSGALAYVLITLGGSLIAVLLGLAITRG